MASQRTLDEIRIEAFLDGLNLGRLEGLRRTYDFPKHVPSPDEEYVEWPTNEYAEDEPA